MVIGDGIYLTPAEIRPNAASPRIGLHQLLSLGHIEANRSVELPTNGVNQNLIAANVATEFIRMGVQAVVAAGWAVDDAAALTFATAFYDRMLGSVPFGKAVKEARTSDLRSPSSDQHLGSLSMLWRSGLPPGSHERSGESDSKRKSRLSRVRRPWLRLPTWRPASLRRAGEARRRRP